MNTTETLDQRTGALAEAATQATARWEPDGEGVYRSGEHRIRLGEDPTRVWLETAGGEHACEVVVPDEWDWRRGFTLIGVLTNVFAEHGLPSPDGLEAWCAHAEALAHDRYLELEQQAELARLKELGRIPGRLAEDLEREASDEVEYVVPGFLKRGWTTKLAGREKLGKGTLNYYVLGRVERGEDTVFGPTSQPLTTLILSEEPADSTAEKVRLFKVARSRIIYGFELRGFLWEEKVDSLVKWAGLEGHGGIFIDNVSRAAMVEDEAGTEFGRKVEYLQDRCREHDLFCLIDHHHKKGRGAPEDKSRGSTTVAGAADINIDMFRADGARSRKRRVTSVGRVRSTSWEKGIELAEDGASYTEVELEDAEHDKEREDATKRTADLLLLQQMRSATAKEFQKGLVGAHDGHRRIGERTAKRRLDDLVAEDLAQRDETTRPYVYRASER